MPARKAALRTGGLRGLARGAVALGVLPLGAMALGVMAPGVMAPGAFGVVAPVAAQAPTLDRVDSLLVAGEYDGARSDLERWWSARDRFDVPGSDLARGLMLRARLAPDPRSAESDYLAVVLGHPTSPHAPDALLRLGQGLLATGDAPRAAAYLDRLVADYPGRAGRVEALLWLARAQAAAHRPGPACRAAREGLRDASDPDLLAMLRIEAGAACDAAAAASPTDTPAPTAAAPARPAAAPPPGDRSDAPGASGRWSVQAGAFRYRDTADALMERLSAAGWEPRLVRVPGSGLLRVRIGQFGTSGPAARLVDRLKARGFDAVVVGNANQERQP